VCTVLVIDDEKAIVEMLCRALTRFGYRVVTALNGRDGIVRFDQSPFDVVVTDVLMPELDGVQVLKHVRQSSRKETPVIAMSGTPNLLGDHDFDLVIAKPFSIYELLAQVRFICPTEAEKLNYDENG
jgi:DNA-binding response OmpR family regulator